MSTDGYKPYDGFGRHAGWIYGVKVTGWESLSIAKSFKNVIES